MGASNNHKGEADAPPNLAFGERPSPDRDHRREAKSKPRAGGLSSLEQDHRKKAKSKQRAGGPATSNRDAIVGLEVHVQLATERKLFSSALRRHSPDTPNVFIDAFSLGLPGALPVLNPEAVTLAVRCALALECRVARRSEWDRKHYFYPDLPKGYQITQQRSPLGRDGQLEILGDDDVPRTIRIVRVHLEEDAGKSVHGTDGWSRVDFNRAGAPLIEIVSAPDLRSPAEARRFMQRIRAIVRAVGASTAHMEQGELRADANVSLGLDGQGGRVEIKNLNSFRHVEQALAYEIERQRAQVESGQPVSTETRRWDPSQHATHPTRTKESLAGYRYLPEPDLPPLALSDQTIAALQDNLPELPHARSARYRQLGLPAPIADSLADDAELASRFDRAATSAPTLVAGIAGLLVGEVSRLRNLNPDLPIAVDGDALATLARAKDAGRISSTQQKTVLTRLWQDGGDAEARLAEIELVTDADQLGPIAQEILDRHPAVVEKYRAGKRGVLGYLMGEIMKATRGRADPPTVRALLEQLLENKP